MIKEVKIDGMEKFSAALIEMKKGTAPAITSEDAGKILTASYNAETGGSASWEDAPESVPEVTSGDAGKVLTAHYTEGVGSSMSWDAPSAPVSLVIDDNGAVNHIGDYREHSGDNVIVHPIVSKYIAASGTWGYTNNYGPTFTLSDCYKILSVTVLGTWRENCEIMEKVGVFYDPTETVWKTYRTGNALADIYISSVIVEYAQIVS